MSNHPSVPNRYQGPKGIPFAMGFGDAPRPALSTPVHNGLSTANVFDPTEKLKAKKTEQPKKKEDDAAKASKKEQPAPETPALNAKTRRGS